MDEKQIEEGLELAVQYEKRGGEVPTIVQDVDSEEVLMLGYSNRQALKELEVEEIKVDCDQDALLYRVEREGKGVCHTKDSDGERRTSCFYRRADPQKDLEFI